MRPLIYGHPHEPHRTPARTGTEAEIHHLRSAMFATLAIARDMTAAGRTEEFEQIARSISRLASELPPSSDPSRLWRERDDARHGHESDSRPASRRPKGGARNARLSRRSTPHCPRGRSKRHEAEASDEDGLRKSAGMVWTEGGARGFDLHSHRPRRQPVDLPPKSNQLGARPRLLIALSVRADGAGPTPALSFRARLVETVQMTSRTPLKPED